jgi:putative adhesin
MRQIFFIIAIVFLELKSSVAQKTIHKEFSSDGIKALSIVDDAIFKITIHSSEEKEIKLSVHISGEHSEDVIIEENLKNNKLSLKTGFSPFVFLEDDKLAAHKVLAVEIVLIVPNTISVEVKSKLASIFANGNFKALAVSLENSNCELRNFSGNAHLKTKDGNINVVAESGVSGIAISINGTVENMLPKRGKFTVQAESVNGNIRLLQTK